MESSGAPACAQTELERLFPATSADFVARCGKVEPVRSSDFSDVHRRRHYEAYRKSWQEWEQYHVTEEQKIPTDPELSREFVRRLILADPKTEAEFLDAQRKIQRELHISLSKNKMMQVFTSMQSEDFAVDSFLSQILIKKAVRTQSGVVVITILTSPGKFSCPHDCHYCPNEPGQPRSYLSTEPAVMRGNQNSWDAAYQFWDRARTLHNNGHLIDKIEVLVLGGTWSGYPRQYQDEFIRDVFYAANTFDQIATDNPPVKPGSPAMSRSDEIKHLLENSNLRQRLTLFQEQTINETATCRIIGLTLETRPDFVTVSEIKRLRYLGCTRIQIGIQHTDDAILDKINRGCHRKHAVQALRLLKDSCFKVDIHLMPDLPGSSPEKDKLMFEEVLSCPELQADQWKVYPCEVTPFSKIEEWQKAGTFIPYAEVDNGRLLTQLLVRVKAAVHPWIRLNRVARDIPNCSIIAGNNVTNLRQLVQDCMKKRQLMCRCLRCREVKKAIHDPTEFTLKIRQYDSLGGKEYFLSFETQDEKTIAGFLRLRICDKDSQEKVVFTELIGCGLVRELHVYGRLVGSREKKVEGDRRFQHTGYGRRLLYAAEVISHSHGLKKMAVIAGIGVRDYYRKFGYEIERNFMTKPLNAEALEQTRVLLSMPSRLQVQIYDCKTYLGNLISEGVVKSSEQGSIEKGGSTRGKKRLSQDILSSIDSETAFKDILKSHPIKTVSLPTAFSSLFNRWLTPKIAQLNYLANRSRSRNGKSMPEKVAVPPRSKHHRHAFVTWVILNQKYLCGALVLGSSLRFHSPEIQRICLISRCLANPSNLNDLRNIFDKVIIVDLLLAEAVHPTWTRFETFYEGWIQYCFTKLETLKLGALLELEKILVLDADCLAVADLSGLFDLETPAGCLSLAEGEVIEAHKMAIPLGAPPEFVDLAVKSKEKLRWKESQGSYSVTICHRDLHKQKISPALVAHAVATNYGIRGAVLLLRPLEEDYNFLMRLLKERHTELEGAIGSYGDNKCHIGPDERLLSEGFQMKYGWTGIHPKYCTTSWHQNRLGDREKTKCLHYVSQKPWDSSRPYYPDFDLWYQEAAHLLSLSPQLKKHFEKTHMKLNALERFSDIAKNGFDHFYSKTFGPSSRYVRGTTQRIRLSPEVLNLLNPGSFKGEILDSKDLPALAAAAAKEKASQQKPVPDPKKVEKKASTAGASTPTISSKRTDQATSSSAATHPKPTEKPQTTQSSSPQEVTPLEAAGGEVPKAPAPSPPASANTTPTSTEGGAVTRKRRFEPNRLLKKGLASIVNQSQGGGSRRSPATSDTMPGLISIVAEGLPFMSQSPMPLLMTEIPHRILPQFFQALPFSQLLWPSVFNETDKTYLAAEALPPPPIGLGEGLGGFMRQFASLVVDPALKAESGMPTNLLSTFIHVPTSADIQTVGDIVSTISKIAEAIPKDLMVPGETVKKLYSETPFDENKAITNDQFMNSQSRDGGGTSLGPMGFYENSSHTMAGVSRLDPALTPFSSAATPLNTADIVNEGKRAYSVQNMVRTTTLPLSRADSWRVLNLFAFAVSSAYEKMPTNEFLNLTMSFTYSMLSDRFPLSPLGLASTALDTLSFVNTTQALRVPPRETYNAEALAKMFFLRLDDQPETLAKICMDYFRVASVHFADQTFRSRKVKRITPSTPSPSQLPTPIDEELQPDSDLNSTSNSTSVAEEGFNLPALGIATPSLGSALAMVEEYTTGGRRSRIEEADDASQEEVEDFDFQVPFSTSDSLKIIEEYANLQDADLYLEPPFINDEALSSSESIWSAIESELSLGPPVTLTAPTPALRGRVFSSLPPITNFNVTAARPPPTVRETRPSPRPGSSSAATPPVRRKPPTQEPPLRLRASPTLPASNSGLLPRGAEPSPAPEDDDDALPFTMV